MIDFNDTRVILAQRRMTQTELAQRTGIRPPTISAICTGSIKHLPVDVLNRICCVLQCQPADLMRYIPDEEENDAQNKQHANI